MRLFSFFSLVVVVVFVMATCDFLPGRAEAGGVRSLAFVLQESTELPARSALDDPVAPLELREGESESDCDRSKALALFSAARAMELRGRSADSLRYYQRALFYEPSSTAAVEGVVRMAKKLGREAERLRYLIHWAELAPTTLPPEVMVDLMDSPEGVVSRERLIRVLQLLVDEREKAKLRSPGDLLLYWRLAEMLVRRNRFDAAANAAAQVVRALEKPKSFGLRGELAEQIERQSLDALSQFADLFVDVGRTDEAERLYRKINARASNPLWLDLRLACIEIKKKNPKAALKYIEPVLDRLPEEEGFTPLAALAEAYEQQGRADELTKRLETLRKKFPEHVPLLCFLGEHYIEKKDYDRAKEVFLTSLKFQPTRTALVGIGEVGLHAGDPTPWLGFLARQFELCGCVTTLNEQVDRVARDPKLLEATLKAAERILRDAPDRLGKFGPLATAVIALRGKQFKRLEKLLPQVEASTPDETIQLLLCWGTILFEEEKYAEAAKVFEKGLKRGAKKEEYVSLEYLLAATLEMQGKTDRALRAIDRAIACDPASTRLGYQKAWIFFHAKRNKEARHEFRTFLAKHGKTCDKLVLRLLVADARQLLAYLASQAGDVKEAEEQLLMILDEFPDDVSAKNDLAFFWADRGGDLQKSLRLATDAVRAAPEDANYHDTLGWTYFRLGRSARAVEELRRALELAPKDKEISAHLNRVLEFSKKTD